MCETNSIVFILLNRFQFNRKVMLVLAILDVLQLLRTHSSAPSRVGKLYGVFAVQLHVFREHIISELPVNHVAVESDGSIDLLLFVEFGSLLLHELLGVFNRHVLVPGIWTEVGQNFETRVFMFTQVTDEVPYSGSQLREGSL